LLVLVNTFFEEAVMVHKEEIKIPCKCGCGNIVAEMVMVYENWPMDGKIELPFIPNLQSLFELQDVEFSMKLPVRCQCGCGSGNVIYFYKNVDVRGGFSIGNPPASPRNDILRTQTECPCGCGKIVTYRFCGNEDKVTLFIEVPSLINRIQSE
jgi:hypothetical protein